MEDENVYRMLWIKQRRNKMGWDCYAVKDGVCLERIDHATLKDDVLRKEFGDASKKVQKKCKCADGLLSMGGLGVSDCAHVLEAACDMVCWTEEDLTPVQVREHHKKFDVAKVEDQYEAVHVESAIEFLRVCVRNNLGITFSF